MRKLLFLALLLLPNVSLADTIAFNSCNSVFGASGTSTINWTQWVPSTSTNPGIVIGTAQDDPGSISHVYLNGVEGACSVIANANDGSSAHENTSLELCTGASVPTGASVRINVVQTGTSAMWGSSATYTGVNQSNTPDSFASRNCSAATSCVFTTTAVGAGAWAILAVDNSNANVQPSGATGRCTQGSGGGAAPGIEGIMDSNGIVSGSTSLTATNAPVSSSRFHGVILTLIPASAAAASPALLQTIFFQ